MVTAVPSCRHMWFGCCCTSHHRARVSRGPPALVTGPADTLRKKLEIRLSILPGHTVLTGQPVLALTLQPNRLTYTDGPTSPSTDPTVLPILTGQLDLALTLQPNRLVFVMARFAQSPRLPPSPPSPFSCVCVCPLLSHSVLQKAHLLLFFYYSGDRLVGLVVRRPPGKRQAWV